MFGRGVALGLAIAAALILVWVAWQTRALDAMFRDFGTTANLPVVTRFVLGPWHIITPGAALAAVAYLSIRRPASLAIYVVVGVLAFGAAVFTWYADQAPFGAIADDLKD